MATSLSSGIALAALLQTPAVAQPPQPAPPTDTVAVLWARVQADSSDVRAWFALGREYRQARGALDSAAIRARLDTADAALARVVQLDEGALGDSARAFRVFAWGERALLAWRGAGMSGAADVWARLPTEARLPAELEELGENLLRACPERGVLITAGEMDTHAAWYLQFVRRLRPDLVVVPLYKWMGDGAYRADVAQGLGVAQDADPKGRHERLLVAAGRRRPLCASMAFARPPFGGTRWQGRPLVWVSGRVGRDRVPPEDFVFAALRVALDESGTWAAPTLELYRRAAAATRPLCRPLKTFGITSEVGCRS